MFLCHIKSVILGVVSQTVLQKIKLICSQLVLIILKFSFRVKFGIYLCYKNYRFSNCMCVYRCFKINLTGHLVRLVGFIYEMVTEIIKKKEGKKSQCVVYFETFSQNFYLVLSKICMRKVDSNM